MRPATGWIAYVHLDALRLEQVGERAHVVLRLRDREPVAGDEDDLVRVGEHHGDVLGARAAHGAAAARRRPRPPARVTWPNAPKRTFVIERFIARPISSVSERARRADEHAADDQHVALELEAGRAPRRGPVNAFRSEITTGMSAPPIGSTKRIPKSSAPPTSDPEEPLVLHARDERDARRRAHARKSARVHELLARVRDRAAADQLLQLRERDHRARERDRADQRREDDRERRCRPSARRDRGGSGAAPRARSSAAAPPPTPLKSATICGIAVIFTLRAATAPKPPPITIATAIAQ